MHIKFFLIIFFLLCHITCVHGVKDGDESEDKGARIIIKTTTIPKAIKIGEWIGEGWGFAITDWLVNRTCALRSGSYTRAFFGGSLTGNLLEEWAPIGRKAGSYIGAIVSTFAVMFLVDRYYSPWKRFFQAISEFNFKKLKQTDKRKLMESAFCGIGIGGLIYLDLRKK